MANVLLNWPPNALPIGASNTNQNFKKMSEKKTDYYGRVYQWPAEESVAIFNDQPEALQVYILALELLSTWSFNLVTKIKGSKYSIIRENKAVTIIKFSDIRGAYWLINYLNKHLHP